MPRRGDSTPTRRGPAPSTRSCAGAGRLARPQHRRRRAFWRGCAGVRTRRAARRGARHRRRRAGGGAGAARRAGAAVTCYGRDRAQRRRAGCRPRRRARRSGPSPPGSWDLLVNATPVGTHPDAEQSRLPGGATRRQRGLRPGLQPAATRALLREAPARGCRTIGGLEMLVAQAESAVRTGGRASGRLPGRMREAAAVEAVAPGGATHEPDDVRGVRGTGPARHVRAGVQGDHGRPADAGVGLPEDRRALRLRVPARERGGRRAGRALLVPRQGPVPDPARARRPDADRARRRDARSRDEPFVDDAAVD